MKKQTDLSTAGQKPSDKKKSSSSKSAGKARQRKKESPLLHCSFCGKSQEQVKKLIAGPHVYICDECIAICNEIIADGEYEKNHRIAQSKFKPGTKCVVCTLCQLFTPHTECLHILNRAIICFPCLKEIETTQKRSTNGRKQARPRASRKQV